MVCIANYNDNQEVIGCTREDGVSGGMDFLADCEALGMTIAYKTQSDLDKEKADKEKAERKAIFNKAWDNLKIGYSSTSKTAFQIQYGNEINENLEATKLYNISDLNNIVEVAEDDYLFKLDQDNVNIMNAKLNAEWKVTHKNWYGSLGTYQLSNIEIGVIIAKGDEVVQQYADEILGEA